MSHRVPTTTREAVLAVLSLCDCLGEAAFLSTYGFRGGRWRLFHGERSYPSKAILGVASGMRAAEFSGGKAHTVRVLQRLGFEVREVRP